MVNLTKSSAAAAPRSVSFIAWALVLLGCTNLWRAVGLARQSHVLAELGGSLSPTVRLAMALLWATVFVVLSSLLWQQRAAARWLVPLTVLVYGAYQLGLIAFFFVSPAAQTGWQATLVFYLSFSLLIYWALNRHAVAWFWRRTSKTSPEAIPSGQNTLLQE